MLIRGTEKGTNISKALYDELVKNKGTIEGHSHPFVGDLVPSEADRDLIKTLAWQDESMIIEPSMKGMRYNGEGAIERSCQIDPIMHISSMGQNTKALMCTTCQTE